MVWLISNLFQTSFKQLALELCPNLQLQHQHPPAAVRDNGIEISSYLWVWLIIMTVFQQFSIGVLGKKQNKQTLHSKFIAPNSAFP